jgi:cytochrome P450
MAVDVSSSLEEEVLALLAGRRTADPFAVFARMRDEAPDVTTIADTVFVTEYDAIRETLNDQEHYGRMSFASPSRLKELTADWSDENRRLLEEEQEAYKGKLANAVGADHERIRKVFMRFFTPKQVKKLEEYARGQWAEILDQAEESGGVYDHRAAAQDYALRIVTHIGGAPEADRQLIANLGSKFSAANSLVHDEQAWRKSYEAGAELRRYISEEIIGGYQRNPGSNEFVSTMMDVAGEDVLTHSEMVSTVDSVFFAGLDTTSTFLTNMMPELLTQRDQWQLLCDDQSLVPGAIEELLRYVSPVQAIPRLAKSSFEFRGVEIPAERTVVSCVAAAHRDPRRYERPDVLDVRRQSVQPLTLGYGFRYCVGASLVRMDIRVALSMLAERYPNIELACDRDDLEWGGNLSIRTVSSEMPVNLGPRRA